MPQQFINEPVDREDREAVLAADNDRPSPPRRSEGAPAALDRSDPRNAGPTFTLPCVGDEIRAKWRRRYGNIVPVPVRVECSLAGIGHRAGGDWRSEPVELAFCTFVGERPGNWPADYHDQKVEPIDEFLIVRGHGAQATFNDDWYLVQRNTGIGFVCIEFPSGWSDIEQRIVNFCKAMQVELRAYGPFGPDPACFPAWRPRESWSAWRRD